MTELPHGTPNEILGVPVGAEKRAIKRAYAKLIKQHRPDEDPEAFRRIHDAYQTLLVELEFGSYPVPRQTEPFTPVPNPTAPEPEPERLQLEDPALELQPLDAPEPSGGPDDSPPLLPPASPPPLPTPPLPLVAELDVAELFQLLQDGDLAEAARRIEALSLFDMNNCRVRLADAILADPARLMADEYRIQWVLQLAEHLAFRHPDKADALLDLSYQHLPLGSREYCAERVGWFTAVAPMFREKIAPKYLCFWSIALASPDLVNWRSAEAAEALEAVHDLGFWQGYALLKRTVPPELQQWRVTPPPLVNHRYLAWQKKKAIIMLTFIGLFFSGLFVFGWYVTNEEEKTGADLDGKSAGLQFLFESDRHFITVDGVQYEYVIKTNPKGIKRVVVEVGEDYVRFTEPEFEVWKTNDLHKVAAPE